MVDMLLLNATTTVRNRPILDDFKDNIQIIGDIDEILDRFRDDDGQLS